MTDYISREAVVNAINSTPFTMSMFLNEDQCVGARQARDSLALIVKKSIPAADVRPVVRGKWIPDYDYAEYDYDGSTPLTEPLKFQDGWQCNLCGGYMPSEANFCPNCGADMREES